MTDKTDKKEIVIDSEQGNEASEVSKNPSHKTDHKTDSSHHTKEKNRVQKVFHTVKDFLKNHRVTLLAALLLVSAFLNLLFAFWIREMKEHSPSRHEGRGMNAYSYASYVECFRGECYHQIVENGKASPVEHFHASDFMDSEHSHDHSH